MQTFKARSRNFSKSSVLAKRISVEASKTIIMTIYDKRKYTKLWLKFQGRSMVSRTAVLSIQEHWGFGGVPFPCMRQNRARLTTKNTLDHASRTHFQAKADLR